MQDIRIDDEGNQRCWNCGGKNFDEKRTFRADHGRVVIYDGKPLLDDSLVITASNALDRVQKRGAPRALPTARRRSRHPELRATGSCILMNRILRRSAPADPSVRSAT